MAEENLKEYFKVRVSGGVRVALPLAHLEIAIGIDPQSICPIPGVAPGLLGVVDRRGILTWVLDLGHFLELGTITLKPGKKLNAIVMTPSPYPGNGDPHGELLHSRQPKRAVACIVEELEGVFAPPKIKPIRKRLKSRLRPLFRQVAYYEQSGIAILDPTALLQTLHTEAIAGE
ncbi:MAG: chemotaxis protein CheW [Geitlerinemataceae cyanobacterium]